MKKLIYLSYVLCLLPLLTIAQERDWDAVDFIDDYKIKYKISGGGAKQLMKNPTFINDYLYSFITLLIFFCLINFEDIRLNIFKD